MNSLKRQLTRAAQQLRSIATEFWSTAAESGFCCGIRLAAERRAEIMPTAGSCCGVRV